MRGGPNRPPPADFKHLQTLPVIGLKICTHAVFIHVYVVYNFSLFSWKSIWDTRGGGDLIPPPRRTSPAIGLIIIINSTPNFFCHNIIQLWFLSICLNLDSEGSRKQQLNIRTGTFWSFLTNLHLDERRCYFKSDLYCCHHSLYTN